MAHAYADSLQREHLVLVKGTVENTVPLCRVHSECLTGNVFQSQKCDCAEQLSLGLEAIAEEKRGIFMYLRQEGRGIGLVEKLKAYKLQSKGHDTYDANVLLGHDPDPRDYYITHLILQKLGVSAVRLLSNNPIKVQQLEEYGIKVVERVPVLSRKINSENREYLRIKAQKFKHYIDESML